MIDKNTINVVNELFAVLRAVNPAFKQSWPTEAEYKATKRQWVLAFEDADLRSIEQIQKGLSALRLSASPFVPSPGQFIEMCRLAPEDVGAPSVRDAYLEACKKSHPSFGDDKRWSHQAVGYARNLVGAHILMNMPESKTYKLFEDAYVVACQDIHNGKNMSQIEAQKQCYKTVSEITGL